MGLSIQFHATPAENLTFCIAAQEKYKLHLYGMIMQPFGLDEIPPRRYEAIFDYRRIVFGTAPFEMAERALEFHDRNRDALILEIGALSPYGLKESWLTSKASGEAEAIWRKIARDLKAWTKAGALAVHPQTGASTVLRDHRHSEGARRLASSGTAMLPVAGTAVLRFEDL